MSVQNLTNFLNKNISYQQSAMFEFRYDGLFNKESFLIEQLNFPTLKTNTGYVWLDGYKIPVHSTAEFGNSFTFTMYIDEDMFIINSNNPYSDDSYEGKFYQVYHSMLDMNHVFSSKNPRNVMDAEIIPLSTRRVGNKYRYEPSIIFHNALIESISLGGGFSSNATTLAKFDVGMTFSYMDFSNKKIEAAFNQSWEG